MKKINYRKADHIRICLEEDVESSSTGFEDIKLPHASLPEVNLSDVDLSSKLLGKKLDYPILIEALTGGTEEAGKINKGIAAVAQELNIGFGVGSQRAAIEDATYAETFQVRDVAPDILLIANLGAVQLNYGCGVSECKKAVEMIGADALALHANPLQEAIQEEGNTDFTGLTKKINDVAGKLGTPVILKEVGCGISREVAENLEVSAFDVGGLGGTNWGLVEGIRSKRPGLGRAFSDWGIPTAESIIQLSGLRKPVIASGGIRSGVDAAKALALGASAVGMALPVLKAWGAGGADTLKKYLEGLIEELRIAMFLSGSSSLADLSGKAIRL